MMSGSDIDGCAETACGWVTDIRRTDGIEGDEREHPVIKQSVVDCFAMKWTVIMLLPPSVIVNKKFPKMAEKIPHFIYLGKGTAIDAFPSFYLSF